MKERVSHPADVALIQKLAWKPGITLNFAIELVKVGLALPEFGTDDVLECVQPPDSTTSGCAVRMLMQAGLIEHTGRMRASRRKGCNGHRNPLYRLKSHGLGREFLKRYGVQVPFGQRELVLA